MRAITKREKHNAHRKRGACRIKGCEDDEVVPARIHRGEEMVQRERWAGDTLPTRICIDCMTQRL